ncbi:MAG: hypothetical protein DRG09_03545 [Epsilonproteobacteria bacterium]|nr:MAG: hypothetical protein DRG09_03545 [Campylobacterota bacterium]
MNKIFLTFVALGTIASAYTMTCANVEIEDGRTGAITLNKRVAAATSFDISGNAIYLTRGNTRYRASHDSGNFYILKNGDFVVVGKNRKQIAIMAKYENGDNLRFFECKTK